MLKRSLNLYYNILSFKYCVFIPESVYQITSFNKTYKYYPLRPFKDFYERGAVLLIALATFGFSSDQIDIILFDNGTDAAVNNSKKVERWEEVREMDKEKYRTCLICTSTFYEAVGLFGDTIRHGL
jgi:hypothetical protein